MDKEKQKALRKQVAPFEKANLNTSVVQLVNTFIPFFGLWALAYFSLEISFLLSLVFSVVAGGFLVRIFIIFHDCCHFSFFKNRKANRIVGTISGILTLFPYSKWGHEHAIHHATSGNLDKRGIGDIWMMTVEEYKSASTMTKLRYRIYRNPFVMFVLGPIFVFVIDNRFNRKGARRKERLNTYFTNLMIVLMFGGLSLLIGWQALLLVHGPLFFVAGVAGVWLFYVQHTFEESYFEENDEWEYVRASVEGSSYYQLPKLLQWVTGNIGYHHVHHLSPRVPNYKLEAVHKEVKPLQHVQTITIKTSLESLKFHLWDEQQKKFVGFKEAKMM
ncbi:fatty acid desaturase [Alkalihalobacillus alcalophilus ATCC 27647 = CGMCC 1.3604]|uniref:Fatty acid desaturase n=1 Tax=Alkalihalobacillus alcalophilus ATCC 27647 = CGMCC 1.3604 TaxID=1218173 RepID=A0A094WKR4_ALKAL|nr:fatty acid desaturase [Alkalihalobacillus alcalophilus]KGA96543.1 fatty acid desaturase [Alkalihalobacillus alcalophilus ATCC 27647 = CGMCC 1.3604]MED1564150.1 fatty acid desaturase [Alkalihalobacillus alcalophilus]THG91839.1 fatty acid desaturase [Alkalihalobacillus alcalophilus ATCC 27647 = CGMCC 1.3604]